MQRKTETEHIFYCVESEVVTAGEIERERERYREQMSDTDEKGTARRMGEVEPLREETESKMKERYIYVYICIYTYI